jgi:hypothetical protein
MTVAIGCFLDPHFEARELTNIPIFGLANISSHGLHDGKPLLRSCFCDKQAQYYDAIVRSTVGKPRSFCL